MKKFSMLLVGILLLALVVPAMADDTHKGIKVIGKLYVSKGGGVGIGVPAAGGGMMFGAAVAFEDQVFYVVDKFEPAPGKVIYTADGMDGFVHDCPEHGREILKVLIIVPGDVVDKDGNGLNGNKIRLELF